MYRIEREGVSPESGVTLSPVVKNSTGRRRVRAKGKKEKQRQGNNRNRTIVEVEVERESVENE